MHRALAPAWEITLVLHGSMYIRSSTGGHMIRVLIKGWVGREGGGGGGGAVEGPCNLNVLIGARLRGELLNEHGVCCYMGLLVFCCFFVLKKTPCFKERHFSNLTTNSI